MQSKNCQSRVENQQTQLRHGVKTAIEPMPHWRMPSAFTTAPASSRFVLCNSICTHCNSHENRPEKAGKKRPQFSPSLKLLLTIEPIPPTAFTLPQNIGGPQKAGVPYSRSEIQCIVLNETKCLQYISKRRLNDEKKYFKLQFKVDRLQIIVVAKNIYICVATTKLSRHFQLHCSHLKWQNTK